jgi:hypothetical protein
MRAKKIILHVAPASSPASSGSACPAIALAKAEAKNQKDRCSWNHQQIATAFMEMPNGKQTNTK